MREDLSVRFPSPARQRLFSAVSRAHFQAHLFKAQNTAAQLITNKTVSKDCARLEPSDIYLIRGNYNINLYCSISEKRMIQTGVLIESSNHDSKGKCHIKSHRLHSHLLHSKTNGVFLRISSGLYVKGKQGKLNSNSDS